MSLPPRTTVPQSQSSSIAPVSNAFAQEALELQSNMLGIQQQLQNSFSTLQHQISVGVTRINRLVEMANKMGVITPEMLSNASSGSSGFGHEQLDHRSQLHRIPERPTLTLTGRKVDIETPADSMRSSMAVLSPTGTQSSIILSSTVQSPQTGTSFSGASFIVLPPQAQHDRYQYHDPKQTASEQVSVQALPTVLPVSLATLPLLQLQTNSKFDTISLKRGKLPKRDGTAKSNVSMLSQLSQVSVHQNQSPPSPNLGVKWETKDYTTLGVANNTSKKHLLPDANVKRAKSASYDHKFEKTESLAKAMRKRIEPPIESISMDATNSSVSPSATSIGKWVSKIVMGSDASVRQAASADGLDAVTARHATPSYLGTKVPQSRRQSVSGTGGGTLLGGEDDAQKQSRSPLFNVIHSVDMGEERNSSNSYSMDVAPSETGHSGFGPVIHPIDAVKKDNVSFAPSKNIFEQQEVVTNEYAAEKASVYSAISSRKESQSSGIVIDRNQPPLPLPSPQIPFPTPRQSEAVKNTNSRKRKSVVHRKRTWNEFILFTSMFEDRGFDYFLSTEDLSTGVAGVGLLSSGIHTNSPFATIFNILMIFFYFFLIFYLPFRAAYYDRFNYTYEAITFTVSGLLVLDSIINFFTPPMAQRKSSKQLRIPEPLAKWQAFYIKYYMLVDIFSAIPWSEIIDSPSIFFPLCLLSLTRTLRLPRMMSQNPLIEYFQIRLQNTGGLGNSLTQILSIGVILVIFVHLQACVLYYISKTSGDFMDWDKQFSHWGLYPGGVEMAPPGDRYVWMVLQSIGNIFPLEFKAGTNAEQVASFVFSAVGAFLYAALIGLISSAAISYDAPGKLYRQKIDELTEYLNWKNIDNRTKKKLLDYYDFKYRGKYFEESSLLADMNESLRREISMMNCKRLIEKVPFLKRNCGDGRDDIFMGKIATALVPVFFVPGDYVFNQGERSTEMFFVLSGTVNIIVNGCIVASFDDGNFFGEVALIANIPRTASVQAATACNLYSLSAKDFQAIILEFEDIRHRIDQIYEERMMRVRMEQGIPEDFASTYDQSINPSVKTQKSRRLSNLF
ncbi:UNVERIFIED_CONTAM: anaphase-promoting complex subunit Hcn1 [Siphonaria sp. JEL0065]|nr:anaphase-promoting complex subunit Hcn1 [Siphonaria sp. JEL0065]